MNLKPYLIGLGLTMLVGCAPRPYIHRDYVYHHPVVIYQRCSDCHIMTRPYPYHYNHNRPHIQRNDNQQNRRYQPLDKRPEQRQPRTKNERQERDRNLEDRIKR